MTKIIDGKAISERILDDLSREILKLNIKPKLVAIMVGDNPASHLYVKLKSRAAEKIGVSVEKIHFDKNSSQKETLDKIQELNNDKSVTGIMIQLPLPDMLNEEEILNAVSPSKDVDGLTSFNLGKTLQGNPTGFLPATVFGVLILLREYEVELKGKNVCIIGQSNEVGKPLAGFLGSKKIGATVTTCNEFTKNLNYFTTSADVLISAAGVPNLIKKEMIKPKSVVIDVGTTKVKDDSKKSGFRISGDVDFESAKEVVSLITPVPGGVGPMTVASLMMNVLKAAKQNLSL